MDAKVWSIGELTRRARLAVAKEFRGPVWVVGELTKFDDGRATRFLELVERGGGRNERDAHLRGWCASMAYARIQAKLAAAGIGLRAGQRVVVHGELEVDDRGALSLKVTDVDVAALVGERLLARQDLLRRLAAEDVLDANRRLPLPPVPLRVTVIASEGSDGHRDLVRQLEASGYAFRVVLRAAAVEGVNAAREIAAAVGVCRPGSTDVAVIVRGGGAKAALDAFDAEVVARAIAGAAVPVWTGIGHAGDRTVADRVAHRCCDTPTAAGLALVEQVAAAWRAVHDAGVRIDALMRAALDRAGAGLDGHRRGVTMLVRSRLAAPQEALGRAAGDLERLATRRLDEQQDRLVAAARAAGEGTRRALADAGHGLVASASLLGAYDPARQLRRGWTLTRKPSGRIIGRVAELAAGDELVTAFADGTARSRVIATDLQNGEP